MLTPDNSTDGRLRRVPGGREVAQRSSVMLFEQRFWAGLADGSVTMTFRRWKKRQVLAGNRYRTPAGRLEVESVDIVEPSAITDDEARRSGYPSAAALRRRPAG